MFYQINFEKNIFHISKLIILKPISNLTFPKICLHFLRHKYIFIIQQTPPHYLEFISI